jgi:gamma-glutamylcyclotransferase (GGCT)/AIG2-like uncharacterized protein YtfP
MPGGIPDRPADHGEHVMSTLFAYGTLMCEDIFYAVTGTRRSRMGATLHDYSRHPVAGEVYPGIMRQGGAVVEGIVYLDLPGEAWRLLDRFEGEMYERRTLQVTCGDGMNRTAGTYTVRPGFISLLAHDRQWDFRTFLAVRMKYFQEKYPGFASAG